jgi:hypothetical protein
MQGGSWWGWALVPETVTPWGRPDQCLLGSAEPIQWCRGHLRDMHNAIHALKAAAGARVAVPYSKVYQHMHLQQWLLSLLPA